MACVAQGLGFLGMLERIAFSNVEVDGLDICVHIVEHNLQHGNQATLYAFNTNCAGCQVFLDRRENETNNVGILVRWYCTVMANALRGLYSCVVYL